MRTVRRIVLIIICGWFNSSTIVLLAQSVEVPHKLSFAGISLTIQDDAKAEIQREVDALTRSPKYFEIKVQRARIYFPLIEKILREENIPLDLKFLVLQESSLVPDAVSTSNAVGYWQFKAETAREVGLVINNQVDERMNILSATKGAANYFKKSNTFFNNWLMVIQSYQMGIGGTMRMVGDRFNGLRHMDITSETYWYVKKFLAHKIAFENTLAGESPTVLKPLMIKNETKFDELARNNGVSLENIREYNKWAREGVIPGDREYVVLIPTTTLEIKQSQPVVVNVQNEKKELKSIQEGIIVVNGLRAIRASNGEGLTSLATRGEVKVSKFLKWNEVEAGHRPVAGQLYYLQPKLKVLSGTHFITTGKETLWTISQQMGIRLSTLSKWNPGMNDGQLKSGLMVRLAPPGNNKSEIEAIAVDPSKPFEWSSKQ